MDERESLEIEIKPAKASELGLLEQEFSPGNDYQIKRYAVQESGNGIYLIAWHKNTPIGHFMLRFNGPEDDPTCEYPVGIPYLSEGGTRSAFRRKGIATKLIGAAEEIARKNNSLQIGLAVGSTDNPVARNLYEKLGYVDWGQGEFEVSWEYKSKDGKSGIDSETCIYMFKDLQ